MRIACIHIPQFALQCASRLHPALRGAPVAVVGAAQPGRGVLHAPIVLACSRAAWALGVRLGMTATAARSLSPERRSGDPDGQNHLSAWNYPAEPALELVTADAAAERETVRAIADALLGVSATVDLGGRVGVGGAHLAMYAEVPAKTRGTSFGDRLLDVLDELGLAARIGIADDRFTAWVAAAHGGSEDRGVVAVPRGGSAAFLAPRSLSLLAISPEVQHMLEALGVSTLGEFAALPAPSVARPLEADYQALARGESDATLRPYTPEAPIREDIVVSAGNVLELQDLLPAGEHAGGVSLGGAVGMLSKRIALRLAGRGRVAARLEIVATGAGADTAQPRHELPVTLDHPIGDAAELAQVLAHALERTNAEHAQLHDVWRLRVVVSGEAIAGSEAQEIFAEGSAAHFASEHEQWAPRLAAQGRRATDHPSADSETIDPLSVVLSSSGSLFALSAPTLRSERRDSHRRTRRGKQRRTRPTPHAQPRLFERTSSK